MLVGDRIWQIEHMALPNGNFGLVISTSAYERPKGFINKLGAFVAAAEFGTYFDDMQMQVWRNYQDNIEEYILKTYAGTTTLFKGEGERDLNHPDDWLNPYQQSSPYFKDLGISNERDHIHDRPVELIPPLRP
ncbi:MAG: hypothetical protein AAGC72_14180 [Planctomycetota bacterium]